MPVLVPTTNILPNCSFFLRNILFRNVSSLLRLFDFFSDFVYHTAGTRERSSRFDRELINHLKQQSLLIKKASITTIDGFCGEIIRNNFASIGLDPAYRVAQEAELALLRADCMNEILEEAYDEGKEELLEFLERFSTKKSDDDVMNAIETLYDYSMSKPDPYKWLVDITSNYQLSSADELFNFDINTFVSSALLVGL